jgi:hypothetical protein
VGRDAEPVEIIIKIGPAGGFVTKFCYKVIESSAEIGYGAL